LFPRRLEAFILLALLAHGLFFGLVHISASTLSRRFDVSQTIPIENVPPELQKILNEDQNFPKMPKKQLIPVAIATPETMTVIPVPANNEPRWIVQLLDIPDESEPEHARFVSERPSRVREELQAEHTAREPVRHSRRKPEASNQEENPSQSSQEARQSQQPPQNPGTPGPQEARRSRTGRNMRAGRAQHQQIAANTENNAANSPERHKTGAREGENNNLPDAGNNEEALPKKGSSGKNLNLLPTYGELGRQSQPAGAANGESAIPGDHPTPLPPAHQTPGLKGEGNGVPGVAEAPENFIPFVKKRGNVTLLNAKSYKFASFVRRLAYRMFDRFVVGFHPQAFFGANWPKIEQGASIEAVINLNGRLVNLKVNRSTGNSRFDSLASQSVRQEAWDSNVPQGAECPDGFIHFIFMPKIIPSDPVDSPQGRVYNSYLIIAIAGLQDCE